MSLVKGNLVATSQFKGFCYNESIIIETELYVLGFSCRQ